MTVTASPFEISVPDEVVNANGSNAAIVAKAVIRIGRSLVIPASISASRIGIPFSVRFWPIRSTMTIALVVTIPISISSPIITLTDIGSSAIHSPSKEPIGTKIKDDRMMNGILAWPNVISMVR